MKLRLIEVQKKSALHEDLFLRDARDCIKSSEKARTHIFEPVSW